MTSRKIGEIMEEVSEIKVSLAYKATTVVLSVIFALICITAPTTICINLLIYVDLRKFIVFMFGVLVTLATFIGTKVYYKAITKNKVVGINKIVLIYTGLVFIFSMIIVIIVYMMGIV